MVTVTYATSSCYYTFSPAATHRFYTGSLIPLFSFPAFSSRYTLLTLLLSLSLTTFHLPAYAFFSSLFVFFLLHILWILSRSLVLTLFLPFSLRSHLWVPAPYSFIYTRSGYLCTAITHRFLWASAHRLHFTIPGVSFSPFWVSGGVTHFSTTHFPIPFYTISL